MFRRVSFDELLEEADLPEEALPSERFKLPTPSGPAFPRGPSRQLPKLPSLASCYSSTSASSKAVPPTRTSQSCAPSTVLSPGSLAPEISLTASQRTPEHAGKRSVSAPGPLAATPKRRRADVESITFTPPAPDAKLSAQVPSELSHSCVELSRPACSGKQVDATKKIPLTAPEAAPSWPASLEIVPYDPAALALVPIEPTKKRGRKRKEASQIDDSLDELVEVPYEVFAPDGGHRSKRARIPRLDAWRGEHIVYEKLDRSGTLSVKAVVLNRSGEIWGQLWGRLAIEDRQALLAIKDKPRLLALKDKPSTPDEENTTRACRRRRKTRG